MINSLKYMIQFGITILLIVLIFQQCTSFNITSASIFKSPKLDTYKYLKDGVESENFIIEYLSSNYPPSVTYNAEYNFFIVESDHDFKKLNGSGDEIFAINKEESMELPKFTHFIFSNNGVYDLSKEEIKITLFKDIVNQDRLTEPKAWIELFDKYYKTAQIVIFGEELSHKQDRGFPIYFKIGVKWIKLFTKKQELRAHDYENALKHNYEGYPSKYTRTIVLKAPSKKTFSDREKEEYLIEDIAIKNYSYKYRNKSKIKSIHFTKEMVYEHIAYTSIPILFAGTSFYKLKIKDDLINFKENAIKPIFMPLQNHFYWYILPDEYFKNSEISFLELRYPSNLNESGSNGLYIIKRKKLLSK